MSQESVDLTYRSHDAFNRRDLHDFLRCCATDIEFMPYERLVLGADPYRGHDGIRTWWEETFEVIPDLRVKLHEVRDLGRLILVHGRLVGQGAASGAPFERDYWGVFHPHRGTHVWWYAFDSETDALAAARRREKELPALDLD
jgi:ketosteroid isomerase-like protein